ncbi:MAG: Hsp20/alpha crystallin family protein [Anaerolineales bacterium]|nr:Hsp20/alpha crystallin family protein [Anaerolineales bacterium]
MKEVDLKSDSKSPVWFSASNPEGGVSHFHTRMSSRSRLWSPPTDVFETDETVVIRIEVAGMQDAEFSISLDSQILTIQGARLDPPERRAYHQMEIRFGEFCSQVDLHWAIDHEGIEAEYDDGFLRIVLLKAKPHQIEIGE